jgi:DNA helicase-2/ATP-dependent DNA helicase PcrA
VAKENLNKEQREAVEFMGRPLLVVAGAGSGKTKTLVAKIEHLIKNGYDPKRILAITFTNKAAKELKERIKKTLGVSLPWVGTFHSVAGRILRMGGHRLGLSPDFVILDRDDSESLLKLILKELETDLKADFYLEAISKYKEGKDTFSYKGEIYKIDQLEDFDTVFNAYQEKLKELNALDFDDLLNYAVRLLKEFPQVREKLQRHFQYILVDEYQDTNEIQYEFIRLLARDNVCVVGDPNQAIYEWRGAKPENILRFHEDFNPKVVKLETNYRSKGVILEIANAVIKKCDPKWVNLIPTLRSSKDFGQKPQVKEFFSERDEAQWIASEIIKLKAQGYQLKNIAILVRSSHLMDVLDKALAARNIPHTLIGGKGIYERKEIKDLLAFLRFIQNPADFLAFERILKIFFNRKWERIYKDLSKYYKTDWVETLKIVAYYLEPEVREPLTRLLQFMVNLKEDQKRKKFADVLEQLLDAVDYYSYLDKETNPERRRDNVRWFLNLCKAFQDKGKELSQFLQSLSLMQSELENKGKGVKIMTVHAAKGLEFDIVFLPRLEEGIFPHHSALENPEELEEERRLFYVAVTRAKEKLYLSFVRKNFKTKDGEKVERKPSRFLKEIPSHLLNIDSVELLYGQHSYKEKPKKEAKKTKTQKTTSGLEKYSTPKLVGKKFRVGQRVKHPVFGEGKIISLNGVHARVDFGGEVKKIHTHFLEKV